MDRVADIAGMIVVLAIVTTVVAHPNSAKVIQAGGNAFTGAIKAAMG